MPDDQGWGGKRRGAGRHPGPKKEWLKIHVLPVTKTAIERLAFDRRQSLGEVVDDKFRASKVTIKKKQNEKIV